MAYGFYGRLLTLVVNPGLLDIPSVVGPGLLDIPSVVVDAVAYTVLDGCTLDVPAVGIHLDFDYGPFVDSCTVVVVVMVATDLDDDG